MKANFEIRTALTQPEVSTFLNCLFNTYRHKYGFLTIENHDNQLRKILFTLCDRKKGLNKEEVVVITSYTYGYFHGKGLPLYMFTWE